MEKTRAPYRDFHLASARIGFCCAEAPSQSVKIQTMKKTILAALALPAALASAVYGGTAADGTLYYTTYGGGVNIHKVNYAYDGAVTFSLSAKTDITSTDGADGIVFNPNFTDHLLIGGQGHKLHEIKTDGTPVATVFPATEVFHLSVDPNKKTVWSGGIPAGLSATPLTPTIGAPVAYTVGGDNSVLDTLAWTPDGRIAYTSSGSGGHGNVGWITIDTVAHTATTTAVHFGLAASHGLTYDPYTDSFISIGDDHITQLSIADLSIVSDLVVPGVNFDQGTVDGKGHVFSADNGGYLHFLDLTGSGLVGDGSNFSALPFLASTLDDIAPLIGPGGGGQAPEAGTGVAGLGLAGLVGLTSLRRMRRQSAK
jgi:hypothetical protein